MNWQPPQYGAPPAQPNAATPQGPYVPPGGAQPPPGAAPPYGAPPPQQGYGPPPGAAPPYGAPPPQQGYGPPPGAAPPYGAPPPQQGYGPPPPQQGGPVAFAPSVLSLDNMQDPDLPPGAHIVVGTGAGGSAAGGKMFRVELRVEKTNNPQAANAVGNYKVWLDRQGLQGGATAHAQAASKDFAMFAVPASGRQLKDCDLNTANNLVGELVNRMTVEGRPLSAIRLGCDVTMKEKKKKRGEYYASVVFYVLPPGA